MCGIAALFSESNALQPKLIEQMMTLIAHRGPDDEGFSGLNAAGTQQILAWGGPATPTEAFKRDYPIKLLENCPTDVRFSALIGNRRLAIVSGAADGHQPMSCSHGRFWLSFNGEIYNYKELKLELTARGFAFESDTDTEVVLNAYRCWGPECLHRFDGQFAFVILDYYQRRFFAARDRFGIKPLYYTASRGHTAFASEIKQLLVLPGSRARMNPDRAYDFLRWGVTDHTKETMFFDILQLEAGHWIEGALNGPLIPRKWYTPQRSNITMATDDALQHFEQLFSKSVQTRLETKHKTGLSLSGGLDSGSIAVVASTAEKKLHSFTYRAESRELDEWAYVQAISSQFSNISPQSTSPSDEDFFESLRRVVWHQDEPFISPGPFAEWAVYGLAKEYGIKVLLDGHGSDELLCGYPSGFALSVSDAFRNEGLIGFIRQLTAQIQSNWSSVDLWGPSLLRQLVPQCFIDCYRSCKGYRKGVPPAWLDNSRLRADILLSDGLGKRCTSVADLVDRGLFGGGLRSQLHWADRSSMAHSIEGRVPFLDHKLVEFCLALPNELLYHRGRSKTILRDSVCKKLPLAVQNRPRKLGYSIPEDRWLRADPAKTLRLLRQSVEQSQGILRPSLINDFAPMVLGKSAYDPVVWRVMIFGLWMGQFGVQVDGPLPVKPLSHFFENRLAAI